MIKKLIFSVLIFLLLILLTLEQASWISIGFCSFLVLMLLLNEVLIHLREKKSFKPCASDLDNLETEVLLSKDSRYLFIKIAKFLNDKFSPKFYVL